jgi:pyruvate formate lyase activating enzyme
MHLQGKLVTLTYGKPCAVHADPVEKKPLFYFLPSTGAFSIAAAGCNLTCKFCQNWDISKAESDDRLQARAMPPGIACAALAHGARAVAFTYNDPVIFLEYAVDTAIECHKVGIQTVAVSAGYISPAPRAELFALMDAANIDLKGFSEGFYKRLCTARLGAVLETLEYIVKETRCWLEITTLLIPGENDSAGEIEALSGWILEHLGPDVPLHVSAFYPTWKLRDVPATPLSTLQQARRIAKTVGLHHVYVGNLRDGEGESTWCASCGTRLIGRSGYRLTEWHLDEQGRCRKCSTPLAGRLEAKPGSWGAQRRPVMMAGR